MRYGSMIMTRLKIFFFLFVSVLLMLTSCDRYDGDQRVPAYLTIEAFDVQSSDAWSSQEAGFFSSEIDAVYVELYVEGDTAYTALGTFTLPCTIPVLRQGDISRIVVQPVVRQNGLRGTRMYYSFYETITKEHVRLTPDSVTSLGTLHTHYLPPSRVKVLWQEFFEPGPSEVSLDSSVVRLSYVTDTVLNGYGCGAIRVKDTIDVVAFWTDTTYTLSDHTASLYLEMDYWSDYDFEVGLYGPVVFGGADQFTPHMTVFGNKEKGWQKIYINIGSTWSQLRYVSDDIRIRFHVFNKDGVAGNVYLDNMKLIYM